MKLLQTIKRLFALCLSVFLFALAAPAFADQTAEAKSAKGVDKKTHQPVDEATEFTVGQRVYVWSKLTDTKGKNFAHVWKKDGKEIRKTTFEGKSATMYRYTNLSYLAAGSYTVEVQSADGTVLTSVSFTVK